MKKTEKISFSLILPCYNVGRYLKKCLDSIYGNSRIEGNEIIIVDDGSPDNEIQVCENYFRVKIEGDITRFTYHGTNVIIICKKNGGLSSARNSAMDVASRPYLLFIDPDDYVADDLLDSVYNELYNKDLDLLLYGFYNVNENEQGQVVDITKILPQDKYSVKSNQEAVNLLMPRYMGWSINNVINWGKSGKLEPKNEFGSVWRIAYSRKFLIENKIRFTEGIVLNEDGLFNAKCMSRVNKLETLMKPLYYYTIRPTGALSKGLQGGPEMLDNKLYLLNGRCEVLESMQNGGYNVGVEIFAGSNIFSIFEMMAKRPLKEYMRINKEYIKHPAVQESIKLMPCVGKIKFDVPLILLKLHCSVVVFLMFKILKRVGIRISV